MNILTKLFSREATVEATAKDDVLDEIRATETRKREQAARERQQTAEWQARVTKEANERLAQTYATMDEIADLVPRLQLACSGLIRNVAEINEKGLGYEHGGLIEDTLGVPADFGEKMLAAIRSSAPNTEWDFGHTGILGKGVKAERPKLRGPREIRLGRSPGEMAPPPGFTGTWDMLRGRPFEEPPVDGQGTSVTFLPPAP